MGQALSQCKWIQELLPRLADGELTASLEHQVLRHLDDCPDCARLLAGEQRGIEQCITTLVAAEPPLGLRARILARLDDEFELVRGEREQPAAPAPAAPVSGAAPWRARSRWLGLAALLCLVALVGFLELIPGDRADGPPGPAVGTETEIATNRAMHRPGSSNPGLPRDVIPSAVIPSGPAATSVAGGGAGHDATIVEHAREHARGDTRLTPPPIPASAAVAASVAASDGLDGADGDESAAGDDPHRLLLGDIDADGTFTLNDLKLFVDALREADIGVLPCAAAADFDGDQELTLADSVAGSRLLSLHGEGPAPRFIDFAPAGPLTCSVMACP